MVFFDDILVYNKTIEDHLKHLRMVLETSRRETLFLKKSKYVFGVTQIEYLGHLISRQVATTDLRKAIAIVE